MDAGRITCPFCWQTIDIDLPDYQEQPVVWTTDCEVCCRPIKVSFRWDERGEDAVVEVEPES